MICKDYLEKIYSGFLGMNIGIRLGAPVEPTLWTYERIQKTYGTITGYVKEYKNFAADDDANGPVYFLRALKDDAYKKSLEPQDVAKAWLNYAREGIGMFWWGGYGVSTEHTAYMNLKNGIPAPESGSEQQNGKILAEQIGGQIFIDTWGLIWPGNPGKAAEYGGIAASVSHDGEGIYGAKFFCACIAEAFVSSDIHHIIQTGLSFTPLESNYNQVAQAVLDFHQKNPDDFRQCYEMLVEKWGYDKHGGVCHIIPNAGVCVLSMIYGNGDFAKTIEIATMCGWDTDCNAGNVGTVLGVMCNPEGIPEHYRQPINDGIVLSGISGYLNILDIPTYAKEVAELGYHLVGEDVPEYIQKGRRDGEIYFDFTLPGSTHNIRISDPFFCRTRHTDKMGGALEILLDRMSRGEQSKIFYKSFYCRDEFSDERYSPVFSPTVYSGQVVSMNLYLEQWSGWETVGIAPYVRTAGDKKEHLQGYIKLKQEEWMTVEFIIPDIKGDLIDEVGFIVEGYSISKAKTLGVLYLGEFSVTGKSAYSIDWSKQRKEFGTITPMAINHGAWEVNKGNLSLMCCEESFGFGGNYFSKNYTLSTSVTPITGDSHLLMIRSKGIMRGYLAGFEKGKAVIYKKDFGITCLAQVEFPWSLGNSYEMTVKAEADNISLHIHGKEILQVSDSTFTSGMYGCGSLTMGRTQFGNFMIQELGGRE